MLDILKNSEEFNHKCQIAKQLSKDQKCTIYVAYIARYNTFKISDWYDDATITSFYCGYEKEFI